MKIGVLGFAHGHVDVYCREWKNHPGMGIEIIAGRDHDVVRLERAKTAHGIATYASIDALLRESEIEGVVIAAETALHAELVEAAANAGKSIVLQKPLALTLAEADKIVDAVNANSVRFSLAWQMRVDPQNRQMKDWIKDGSLGRIFNIRRRHCLSLLLTNPDFKKTWHVDPKMNRDIWADDSAHAIDFLYWIFGRPESVTAELATRWDPDMANDTGVAIFRYPDGLLAEVNASFVSLCGENTTEIIAENGVVIQNFGDAPSTSRKPEGAVCLKRFSREEDRWIPHPDPGVASQAERLTLLARPLAEFFLGDSPPLASAEEGRDVLRMVLATYDSNSAGRRTFIDWK